MTIALINLEPTYINIALEKIKMYYQERGQKVEDFEPSKEIMYSKIYCSSIFDFTSKEKVPKRAICGGTGFDLYKTLPKKIEEMEPKINIGFTTRGCIRNCPYCVVPRKEGKIRVVGDIYNFWDGFSKSLILLDNNILALPEHFHKICQQIRKENLKVDFNQGLDIRLVNKDIIKSFKSIKIKKYRFSFDDPKLEGIVIKKLDLLFSEGIKRCLFYILVGYNTSFKEDLHRLNLLKSLGQRAYLMRYKKDPLYTNLAGWVNQQRFFMKMTYEQFDFIRKNRSKRTWLIKGKPQDRST